EQVEQTEQTEQTETLTAEQQAQSLAAEEKVKEAEKFAAEEQAKLDAELEAIEEEYAAKIAAVYNHLNAPPDAAELWREWLVTYEGVDRLLGEELKRCAGFWSLIDKYQTEAADPLREVRDQTLEGDYSQQVVQAPPIAASQVEGPKLDGSTTD